MESDLAARKGGWGLRLLMCATLPSDSICRPQRQRVLQPSSIHSLPFLDFFFIFEI